MIFQKYHGTGNDFIMIDGRDGMLLNEKQVKFLCDRHFGIGSDGLLIVRKSDDYDFKMEFFNPDGSEASFCGNGARCIVKFAENLGIFENNCFFEAKDGLHSAETIGDEVKLKMIDVDNFYVYDDLIYLNTGTHHVVKFVDNVEEIDILATAPEIRYDERFAPEGTNVNFVQIAGDIIKVRTYEKGVEAETLSCGTGVVASALAFALKSNRVDDTIFVKAKGGNLKVSFLREKKGFKNVYLQGPAKMVFFGEIDI